MIYCLRIEGWKRGAKLNRGQRLGAASCYARAVSRVFFWSLNTFMYCSLSNFLVKYF
ncbi:hypothetical protein [Rubritalea tangerina]|uniref:hypothetical protein n=1 Tax=Rubritalea tangerina TaxID=430798 RepID=UPI00361FAD60